MIKILSLLLAFVSLGAAQIPTVSLPHVFATDSTPRIRYVYENDTIMANRIIEIRDSINGDSVTSLVKSLGSMRLTLDNDDNGTGHCLAMTHNGATDTIAKFCDDLSSRAFGALTISGRTTLTDSLIGVSQRLSGNLAAVNGAFSGTVGVGGIQTNSSRIVFDANVSGASGALWKSSVNGLSFRGVAGSTYDWAIESPGGNAIIGNPTGAQTFIFPNSAGGSITGDLTVGTAAGGARELRIDGAATNRRILAYRTGGLNRWTLRAGNGAESGSDAGSDFELTAFNDGGSGIDNPITITRATGGSITMSRPVTTSSLHTASGGTLYNTSQSSAVGKIYYAAADGLSIRGIAGSSYDLMLYSADAGAIFANPTGTRNVNLGHASGTVTALGPITHSSTLTQTGAATFATNITQSAGVGSYSVDDNTATAWEVKQGSNQYLKVTTTNSSENVSIGNATTNPSYSILGSGTATFSGPVTHSTTMLQTGIATFTAAPVFSSVTASQTLEVTAGKALTSAAQTGTGSYVKATSPTLVTPALGVATATTIALGGNEAFDYDEGSFTFTATGLTTSPTGTGTYTRAGKSVVLYLPPLSGTSNNVTFTYTGLPASIRPTTTQFIALPPLIIQNNGSPTSSAVVSVDNSTAVTFCIGASSSGWNSSGTKGNATATGITISYHLQ